MDDPEPQQRQVQDDVREQQMSELLRLRRSGRRTGSDARDGDGNRYELKTVTTNNVTTGRDIGMPYLRRLRESYFVVAKGKNTEYGFRPADIYFLSPAMLEEWIAGTEAKLAASYELVIRAVDIVRDHGFTDDEATRLLAIGERGITINNPKISWSYVEKHGLRIGDPPAVRLRELVAANPIPVAEIATDGPGVLEDEGGFQM